MNIQPVEKRVVRPLLSVHSIFETIQGEGPFCGTPCVFIRLAGCNLQCPACDTDYTSNRRDMDAVDIVFGGVKRKRPSGLVVITGGEPFRQDISRLLEELLAAGYYVQIESNGTLAPLDMLYSKDVAARSGVYLVISPKTGRVSPRAWKSAVAAKYVIERGKVREMDGLPTQALRHTSHPYVARPPVDWDGTVYVQPIDVGNVVDNDIHTAEAVDSCLKFGYILQLQIHKIIGVA